MKHIPLNHAGLFWKLGEALHERDALPLAERAWLGDERRALGCALHALLQLHALRWQQE